MSRSTQVLTRLQSFLERVYDVSAGYRVCDFLVTNAVAATALSGRRPGAREKLLIRQSADTVDVSLYLDDRIMRSLQVCDPFDALHDGNLDALCAAVEGVSHFTYLAFNASHEKRITLIELELQAEVDKFVVASTLLRTQNSGRLPRALCHRLFHAFRLSEDLDQTERQRYLHANRFARDYCRALQRRMARGARVLSELRRFYRLPKLAKIDRSVAAAAG